MPCGTKMRTFNHSGQFTRLVRYAYDRGIRFFDTAEAYETPGMLGGALKGLPRDSYQLMSKVSDLQRNGTR